MLYTKQLFFVAIYTILVMVLFGVPSYFALSSTINEERYKASKEITEWMHAKESYIFAKEPWRIPQSVRFKIAIYDQAHQVRYSDLRGSVGVLDFKTHVSYPYMYALKEVIDPKGALYYVVVELKINHTKIVFVATILFFITLFLVFLMSMLFANTTIYPYRKKQQTMHDFFNDAMHELKTPLGVIGVNLELMAHYVNEPKHLGRIKAAVKQMQMTYEDVEYYIKHKKVHYTKEVLNLSEYLWMRIHFFEDIAKPKAIVLQSSIEEGILVNINKVELQRILDNTLSNAIKYSPYGAHVFITLERIEDERVVLSIKDEGQGIKDIHKVLQRFEREDGVQGGFGLGLNIVQNICNQNGIEMEVRSQEQKGSTFIYTFKHDRKKWLDAVDGGGKT